MRYLITPSSSIRTAHGRFAAAAATRIAAALAVLAATAGLVACGRENDTRSAGQQIDAAIAKTEQKVGEVAADAREAARDAKTEIKQAAGTVSSTVADKSRDVGITAEVKSRLARDEQLNALSINVDTDDGRVVLRGSAPDTASRGRASELARAVDGVREVDNELSVQPPLTN